MISSIKHIQVDRLMYINHLVVKKIYLDPGVPPLFPLLPRSLAGEGRKKERGGTDVNSLYPYVMKEFAVPVGNPLYFESDVFKFRENPFGVFEVKITAPKDMKIPLLQIRRKVNGNTSTLAPLGV
jgi:hypothetical protein